MPSFRHALRSYGLVFAASVLADIVYTFYLLFLQHNWFWAAILTGALIPYANCVGYAVFIDAKTPRARLAVTTATALGIVVGSFVTLQLFRG
jgi:hypothetical protein